jgi:diguanylate cyclase (GGDEF)-like protein
VALLLLDLDRFKNVNDTLGHQAGDALLEQVAVRLSEAARGTDTVARMGGDEFAILTSDLDERDEHALAERLLDAVSHPCRLPDPEGGTREVSITGSIGIALATGPGTTAHDLYREADIALYEAKEGGRARAELYVGRLREALAQRIAQEEALRALLGGGLVGARGGPATGGTVTSGSQDRDGTV